MKFEDMINKVICGDCLEVMKDIPDNSIDLVVTSPPFYDEDVPIEYYNWLRNVLDELTRISSIILLFNSSRRLIEICKRFNPKRILIWNKKVGMGAYRYEPIFIFCEEDERLDGKGRIWNDCLNFTPIYGDNQIVPYQNPKKLYEQLLRYFPDKKLILDPFLGSGTTAVACKKLNRRYIGIELNENYCKISRKRIKEVPKRLDKFVNNNQKRLIK